MSHPLADTAHNDAHRLAQSVDRRAVGTQSHNQAMPPVIGRDEFVKTFGRQYASGQHVTMLGPTQRGKTTLGIQLLGQVVSPERKVVALAGKPLGRDATMASAAEKLNLRVVKEWPPESTFRDRKRNGYVLRPLGKASDDDEAKLEKEFGKALRQLYQSKKDVIILVDEAALVYEDLKLKKEFEAPLKRGAPVVAVWSLLQRGRFVTYHVYAAPEHIFIFYDPDETNRQRYSEIGGVDKTWIQFITANLKNKTVANGMTVSQALYIRRSGPQLAIVDM